METRKVTGSNGRIPVWLAVVLGLLAAGVVALGGLLAVINHFCARGNCS